VLRVSLDEVEVENPLLGERERKQRVTVDDAGTGMDVDVIRRFLLQVGRSFYTSPEFRDRYPFVPTSRFGIGFLSVFAVSDHVELETYNPTSRAGDGAVHLVLTGPRSYLLTSRGTRSVAGTRVGVRLREPMKAGELTDLLRHWCRRVEFPVTVAEGGRETTIEAQEVGGFSASVSTDRGPAVCAVRAFPIESELLDGEVYIPSWTDADGESWVARDRVEEHVRLQPTADIDTFWPTSLVCLHGLNVGDPRNVRDYRREQRHRGLDSLAARVDVRGPTDAITLSREGPLREELRSQPDLLLALEPTYERLLDAHLASTPLARGPRGWRYRQQLVGEFPLPTYWRTAPGVVRAFRAGEEVHCSAREVMEAPRLTVILTSDSLDVSVRKLWSELLVQAWRADAGEMVLLGTDLEAMPPELHWALVSYRKPVRFRLLHGAYAEAVFGSATDALPTLGAGISGRDDFYVVDIDSPNVLRISLQRAYWPWGPNLLNQRHPFTRWIVQLDEARRRGDGRVSEDQFWRLLHLVRAARPKYAGKDGDLAALNAFVAAWRESGALAPDLLPPDAALSPDEFLEDLRRLTAGRRRRRRQ
jgi:hypothetical protein